MQCRDMGSKSWPIDSATYQCVGCKNYAGYAGHGDFQLATGKLDSHSQDNPPKLAVIFLVMGSIGDNWLSPHRQSMCRLGNPLHPEAF